MLTYVDHAREAGERFAGSLVGRHEASAAAHELSLALMLPVATIESTLAMARRVRSTMPTVWTGWHAGEVSSRKVSLIDQAAVRLTQPTSVALLDIAATDTAPTKTPGQLRSWLDRFVTKLEADAAAERHRRARKDRRVWTQSAGDGMSFLGAIIPTLDAAAIEQRIEAEARNVTTDDRTHEQRRADVFVDALLGATASGAQPTTNVGVIVPIQSLMGLSDAPGELADQSASVPADLIRTHAVRPGTLFWRLLTDQRGNLLDVTRMGRYATGDLGPLHRRAHNLKTEGLLSMRQPEPGVFEWTTRTGHRYTHTADPLPVTAWEQPAAFTPEFLDAVAAMPPPEDLAA